MKLIVLPLPDDTISIKDVKTTRNVVVESATGVAGIIIYDGKYHIEWSSGTSSENYGSLEELMKRYNNCKFYQL